MLPWQHFCQRALGQKFQFFVQNGLFPLQNVFISDFWLEFEISASELIPVPNFSSIGEKIRELEILTWNNTKNGLMTSYLPPSDDISKIVMAFERLCPRVPSEYHQSTIMASLVVIRSQIKKKQRGAYCAPQPIWYQKTPA